MIGTTKMSKLIVTCNLCDNQIAQLALGPENAHDAQFWAAEHLEEKHTKEELAAYLRERPEGETVFWRTTVRR